MSIAVVIKNTDVADLFVTVRDMNLFGTPAILEGRRINEGESVGILVQEDGSGSGSIQWDVQRTDDSSLTAQRTVEVTDGKTVDVTTHFG